MAFKLANNLSAATFKELLKIIQIASQASKEDIKTASDYAEKYTSKKYELKKTYVCMAPKCNAVLFVGPDKLPTRKQDCGHEVNKSKGYCYVIHLPIEMQIRQMLESGALKEDDRIFDGTTRGDIQSGDAYREKVLPKSALKRFLSLQLNVDGARCFVASKFGFWPFMGLYNELLYSARRWNVVLMALWYGNKKPPKEPFLNTAIAELKQLGKRGVDYKGLTYIVKPVVLSTDSQARATFLDGTQCNGLCGCDFCLHPGIMNIIFI